MKHRNCLATISLSIIEWLKNYDSGRKSRQKNHILNNNIKRKIKFHSDSSFYMWVSASVCVCVSSVLLVWQNYKSNYPSKYSVLMDYSWHSSPHHSLLLNYVILMSRNSRVIKVIFSLSLFIIIMSNYYDQMSKYKHIYAYFVFTLINFVLYSLLFSQLRLWWYEPNNDNKFYDFLFFFCRMFVRHRIYLHLINFNMRYLLRIFDW